jgi:hypothetical protein
MVCSQNSVGEVCLKLISEIGGLEWSVCSEILEPPSLVMGHGGSKISEQTDHIRKTLILLTVTATY